MEIRRIRATEGSLLRSVRLRALSENPDAFESTHAEETTRPSEEWDLWASRSGTGDRACLFVADDEGSFVAMAGAYTPEGTPLTRRLIAMWVASEVRGRGIGQSLTNEIVQWSAHSGAEEITLWVVDLEGPARRVYERAGFSLTDVEEPLGSNPRLKKWLMRRPITAADRP